MIDLQNSQCAKCKLCTLGRKNVVNGRGNESARILLVSEWPGSREDETGDILSGPVAIETFKLLAKAGISRNDVFLTTTVRCVPKAPPPDMIRTPTKEEIAACSDYLDQEIAAIKPTVIVPMGTLAVKRIFGRVVTLSDTRGKEHWSDKYNCKVIPIYHPLYLQRKPEYQGFTVEDLRRIAKSAQYPEMTKRVLGQYVIAEDIARFDQIIDRLNTVPHFAYDIETNSLDFTVGKVLSLSFSWKAFTGVTVPLIRYEKTIEERTEIVEKPVRKKNKATGQMEKVGMKQIPTIVTIEHEHYHPYWGDKQEYVLSRIKEAMTNQAMKIAHNGKFDNKFLRKLLGTEVENFGFDTMLVDFMLDENAEDMHGLKDCAWRFTDMGGYEEPLDNWFKQQGITGKKKNYAHLPPEMLFTYAAMDVDCTMRLYDLFVPRLEAENLMMLLKKLIMPLSQTLADAEYHGVLLDKEYQQQAEKALQTEITRLEAALRVAVQAVNGPADMNFNSNDQLANLFFNILHLPVLKRTDTGKPSCDEEVLTHLAQTQKQPIATQILEYKKMTGVLSKYVLGLMERVDASGALHSDFLIHGTVTGRLSSSNPNLQNIIKEKIIIKNPFPDNPSIEEFEVNIKRMFVPRPGMVWVEADYGQAEFRHWANYSQDPDMIRDIKAADDGSGPDIHKKTASDSWNIPLEKVTKEIRDRAKAIVFGIMYGRGAESVSQDLGISIADAQQVIDKFFAKYPVAKRRLDDFIVEAKRTLQVTSVFGRIRRLPGIWSPKNMIRQENERLATNSPIQSAASDMNCNAANRIRMAFKDQNINGGVRILVHDAIYCEIAETDFERGITIMRQEMERPISGVTVPMRAEFKVGRSWGEEKDYHFAKKEEAHV